METKTYSEKLKNPRWQKKRLLIMQRDKFKCKLCKDEETTLNVHHLQYTEKDVWNEPDKNLITVCEHCHIEVEKLKNDNVEFEKISIYKSNNWKGGSRIMFISFNKIVRMSIYNDDKSYVIGYNLQNEELSNINKIISKTIKNGNI